MTQDEIMANVDFVLARVRAELERSYSKHGPIASAHEGYAVLLEEVDELWDEVKADNGYTIAAFTEAEQVAAMAVRYIVDLADKMQL